MELVLLTALGVGSATVIGSLLGFLFKNISHRFSDIVLSFAAGVMLAAAVFGLVIPSLEHGGKWGLHVACAVFPDQGLNPCVLRWQTDSYLLCHQGSPK